MDSQTTMKKWEIIGPGGGGRLEYPVISPHDSNLLFCSNDMHGAYRSEDKGTTWSFIPHTTGLKGVHRWFFHPTDPDVVFAGTHKHYFTGRTEKSWRSDDRGRHWHPLPDDFPTVLAFDPFQPGMGLGARDGELFITEDGGQTWQPTEGKLPEDAGSVIRMIAGSKAGEAFIATEHGIFRSEDDGKKLHPATSGFDCEEEKPAIMDFSGGIGKNGMVLFATVSTYEKEEGLGGGIHRSSDGGESWHPVERDGLWMRKENGRLPQYHRLAVCRNNPDVVFAAMAGVHEEVTLGEGYPSVYRSIDGGKTWKPAFFQHPDMPRYNITNRVWTDRNWGFQVKMQGLCINETNSDEVMLTAAIGAFHSSDCGETWRPVHAPPMEGEAQPSGGMPVMGLWGYYFDPHDPDRHYMAGNDFAGWRSTDRGASWFQSNRGNPWPNNVNALAFDPQMPGRIWGAASRQHDIPLGREIGPHRYKHYTGGVIFSQNHGKNWEVIGNTGAGKLPNCSITDICIDPCSPEDSRHLWAAPFGRGTWFSRDGGCTWEERNDGLDEKNANIFRIRLDAHGRWLAMSTMEKRNGKTGFTPASGNPQQDGKDETGNTGFVSGSLYARSLDDSRWKSLFKGRDCAWSEFNPNEYNGDVPVFPTDFDVDPSTPEVMYVSAFPPVFRGPTGGGIWKTEDGGKSWRQCLKESCMAVTVDPLNPDCIFASTFWDGLHVSHDKGETWSRVDSFPFEHPYRVYFDPRDPNPIYVSTFGSMVWRGTRTLIPYSTKKH
ncbi:MAG: hypothetical protein ABFR33_03295 [Verrucomicrobiota bacterium]